MIDDCRIIQHTPRLLVATAIDRYSADLMITVKQFDGWQVLVPPFGVHSDDVDSAEINGTLVFDQHIVLMFILHKL